MHDVGTGAPGRQWALRRSCSMSPSQMVAVYLSLCLLSVVIALPFALNGAGVVLAFAGIELVAVGLAMLAYARHAADGDLLTLSGRCLQVAQTRGPHASMIEFRAEWLSIEPAAGEGSLIELSGQGRRVRVGRFVRPQQRARFAQELRHALRSALDCPSSAHPV